MCVHVNPDCLGAVHQLPINHPEFRPMGLLFLLFFPEFRVMEMMGIFVNGDLRASLGIPGDEFVINEDMLVMGPVGTASLLWFCMEYPKFKRNFAGIDSHENVREITGGFVCHNALS